MLLLFIFCRVHECNKTSIAVHNHCQHQTYQGVFCEFCLGLFLLWWQSNCCRFFQPKCQLESCLSCDSQTEQCSQQLLAQRQRVIQVHIKDFECQGFANLTYQFFAVFVLFQKYILL